MRAPDKPIARISASGYGIQRAAGRVHWFMHIEGPQSVFMNDDGLVYAVPRDTALAQSWIVCRSAWLTGNYETPARRGHVRLDIDRSDIIADLRARLRELKTRAA